MKNKILFLDFDGVLHSSSAGPDELFIKSINLAETLLPHKSECIVVVSSSWRHHYSVNELKNLVTPALGELITDKTGQPFIGKWPRYNEIKEYLNLYAPLANWRALDDSYFEFPNSCSELIRCNPNSGISSKELNLLKEWLKQ